MVDSGKDLEIPVQQVAVCGLHFDEAFVNWFNAHFTGTDTKPQQVNQTGSNLNEIDRK